MLNNLVVQPFALTDAELQDIEQFAKKNELLNIARLCAELRALRSAFMTQSARLGKAKAAATLGASNAAPVA